MLGNLLEVRTQETDPLQVRRSRTLALLLLVMIGVTIPATLADVLTTGSFQGTILNGVAILILAVVYLINRAGQQGLALSILLVALLLLSISGALFIGSPIPTVFFPVLFVAIAAAFGSPRAPLIWAAIDTVVPLIMNLALYRSPLPPPGPILLPDGASAPPILGMEVIAVLLYWLVGGVSWLAARQLYQTIDESRAATRDAVSAQQALATQRTDLASRNEQLTQVRQELEALVASLAVPVVPIADGIGLLPLIGALDISRTMRVEQEALNVVSERRMRALVIDLSGTTGFRTETIQGLVRFCETLRLLGVTPVLAGIGARGAILLSEVGAILPQTTATVQDALVLLRQQN